MLTYVMAEAGGDSLYEHLYKCIKNDILEGQLKAGEKLPSKRTLAKNLSISVVTVESAYSQLMAEGYIYSLPKRGYFVSPSSNPSSDSRKDGSADIDDNDFIMPPIKNGGKEFYADFISGGTIHRNFPFTIWSRLLREVMSEESELLMSKPPSGGIMALREAIALHLKEFRGMKVAPWQIIIGAGTEYLYSLIIQLLGRDKKFGVEDPGYRKISQVYEQNNVDISYIPLDKNGISIKMLEASGADIIHISPSHHYPTGLITPISRRYELLSWADRASGRFIIEDDYDCEFRMSGMPIPTMQSIDAKGCVIYMNTFTKSLASTIRISYMALPPKLAKLFYEKLGFYSCTVSTFEQLTLYKFMTGGYFEKHINRMRNFYKNQRNIVLETIKKSPLGGVCRIREQDAGLHFLLTADTGFSQNELSERAEKLGIHIGFLSQFYHNAKSPDNGSATLVINYSGIEPEKIPHAIELLSRCIMGADLTET